MEGEVGQQGWGQTVPKLLQNPLNPTFAGVGHRNSVGSWGSLGAAPGDSSSIPCRTQTITKTIYNQSLSLSPFLVHLLAITAMPSGLWKSSK